MATQHVKILVRRGLREQLSSDVLDTGEFGFTTDTNQLFIGIDPAINEIQFDPFINAHAIIQSWLDSDDCPFPGLTVDEDLVIRHIPTTYEIDGTPISGVQAMLDAMHFFTQEIDLVGNFDVDPGDTLYQRQFVYADEEADISVLEPTKTYQIREIQPDSDDFFNNASGTIGKTFSKYDNFTVRRDYGNGTGQVPNPYAHNGSRVIEVVDTTTYTQGVVAYTEPYDSINNNKNLIVRVREGYPEFFLDNPYVDNYYHFNGNGLNKILDSDFGLHKWIDVIDFPTTVMRVWRLDADGNSAWANLEFSILRDKPGTGNVEAINDAGYAYPVSTFGDDYDYTVVSYDNNTNFYQKLSGVWNLLAGKSILTGELIISETEPAAPELGDFWVTFGYQKVWVKQKVSIIDEANYPDSIETITLNGVELDKPLVTLFDDTSLEDHVVVTKSSKVTYWHRDSDTLDWALLGAKKSETGFATINLNQEWHEMPDNVLNAYYEHTGYSPNESYYWEHAVGKNWEVKYTSYGPDGETVRYLANDGSEFHIDWYADNPGRPFLHVNWQTVDPNALDGDTLEITYHYNNDINFSDKPPVTFTNQTDTYTPPAVRSTGDELINGDYYVYTDKDISGGTNLNIFQWEPLDFQYQHNTVPVYYSDLLATVNAPEGVLLYALPYKFDNDDTSYGILELRQRDYNTSTMWYPYEYNDILSYYFTTNPIVNLAEPDFTYAYSISGRSEFSVGYLGRARRNVEVITENSFNQLFADQHLAAQESYSGFRPSLFRKIFDEHDGIFLRYNKLISSTFFVDYSLKQVTPTKTFLRVGQLRIINGYPHDIPEIKLTDENTEIWHDNLVTGDNDTIEDLDEFSNIVFETAVGEDAYGNETNDLLIIYRQNPGCTTEVSYTIKRWTM